MVILRSVRNEDKDLFQNTSYGTMSPEGVGEMLSQSLGRSCDGRYFELLAVMDGDICVGFVSLYALGEKTVSCGPEIKPQYRRHGYGCVAVRVALERARLLGFTRAVAQVRRDNAASIALHRKLGFTQCRSYVNKKGHPVLEFEKEL